MFRYVALIVVVLLVALGAWFGRPDAQFLAGQWLSSRLARPLAELAARDSVRPVVRVAIRSEGDDAALEALARDKVRLPAPLEWAEPGTPAETADHVLSLAMESSPHSATLHWAVDHQPPTIRRVAWYAILPPLLAITTAILFRHVILCLVLGILAGGVLVLLPTDQFALWGVWHAFYHYFLHHSVLDTFRLEIIAFVLLICATVGLAQHSGGIHSVINWLTRFCRTARTARIGTALAGLAIFFDDYMNCIIVGNALRPLTDRYRVSRAKLAYIVDSTAAPVAGLALVSTWIAFELSQISEGLTAAHVAAEPFEIFVRTIPYRFYCWFTLALVFVLALMGRDYGPMLAAERRALAAEPSEDTSPDEADSVPHHGRAIYAILPIGLTLIAIVVGLWWTAQPGPGEPAIVATGPIDYLQQILGRANSARAFARASAFGYLVGVVFVLAGGALTLRQTLRASFISMRAILTAIVILLLAWSIGAACREVGTADYLVAMFRSVLNPVGFSLVIFGLSCLVAFSTGSSYSTMAILLPNVVPLALALGEASPLGGMTLIIMSIGAVLEGAIFGDHCSPISDTTILSSISSRCDLIEHVQTQMPYAVTGMLTAVLVGYTPVALGVPPLLCLALGVAVLVLVVRILGRRATPAACGFAR